MRGYCKYNDLCDDYHPARTTTDNKFIKIERREKYEKSVKTFFNKHIPSDFSELD